MPFTKCAEEPDLFRFVSRAQLSLLSICKLTIELPPKSILFMVKGSDPSIVILTMETMPAAVSMKELSSLRTSHVETIQDWVRNEGEQIEVLRSTLREIVWVGANADALLHSLDTIQHEAATNDDSFSDYEHILQSISEISQNIHTISFESLEVTQG